MSRVRVDFARQPTITELFDAVDTIRGTQILDAMEENFVSVSDMLGHTTHEAGVGSIVHFGEGNSVLFEHVPKHEFSVFARELGAELGLNP